MYRLAAGACPKSYGTSVAQLAGLPATLVRQAAQLAQQLESYQASGTIECYYPTKLLPFQARLRKPWSCPSIIDHLCHRSLGCLSPVEVHAITTGLARGKISNVLNSRSGWRTHVLKDRQRMAPEHDLSMSIRTRKLYCMSAMYAVAHGPVHIDGADMVAPYQLFA